MSTRIEHACTYPGDEPDRGQCHDPAVHMLMAGLRIATAERDRLAGEVETLRARLAAVEALADKWRYDEMPDPATADEELRDALWGESDE